MTPHIEANKGDIAKTVLMPGDPLRAKYIAETYLNDYKLVNTVRNIYAYTGYYNNKLITVMASGMGMPSIGIYSYELYKFYDVENIIRIGSAGAYCESIKLYDVILATNAYSKSSYALVQNGCKSDTLSSSNELNSIIERCALEKDIKLNKGTVYSSDVFYGNDDIEDLYNNHNCLATEMESFALFHNANILNKRATALLTISDNLITKEKITPEEREKSFSNMIELALLSATRL